jgi:16S rRNA (cytosine1402-N4)-methyltransferase
MKNDYHVPVLLEESLNGLLINKSKKQVFVDVTFGGGSHSKGILNRMSEESVLYAFDQDVDASDNKIDDSRLVLIDANFRYFGKYLKYFGDLEVDGILADLGVSSYQIDEPSRGFSFMAGEDLDMRMNVRQKLKASDILNNYSESELVNILSIYGEVRNSRQLAAMIIQSRRKSEFTDVQSLIASMEGVILGNKFRYLAQVFQALRIEVNDEMNALKEMLAQCGQFLGKNGRLSVISYHSLEDRLVKNLIKSGSPDGKIEQDVFGNRTKFFQEVVKGVILPNDAELKSNSRSRSAKLRIAEKL